ncbi:MAG: hypothetical protein V1676_07370 [Candidatus Diapherotrites archaeon]
MRPARFLPVALFLVLALCFASAVSIETDSAEYFKGATIKAGGDCDEGEIILLNAAGMGREVFAEKLTCGADGRFYFSRAISNLDPAGIWSVSAEAPSGSDSKEITVTPTKQSQYLLIVFLSPGSATVHRTDSIEVSVRVTDSGEPVADADVVMWGTAGERHALEYKGDGKYSATAEIPFDAPSGAWKLTVTAESRVSGEPRGGEAALMVNLAPTPIKIDVLRPSVTNFDSGSNIRFTVALSYLNGKPVNDAAVTVEIKGVQLPLSWQSENIYDLNYALQESDSGSLPVNITAEDAYGNSGEKRLDLVIGGNVWKFLGFALLAAAVCFAAIAVIAAIALSKLRKHSGIRSLEHAIEETNAKAKRLQEDYFERNLVGKDAYRARGKELDQKLRSLEDRLAKAKGKQQAP